MIQKLYNVGKQYKASKMQVNDTKASKMQVNNTKASKM